MKKKRILPFVIGVILAAACGQDNKNVGVVHLKGDYTEQLVLGKGTREVFLDGCNVMCDTSYALVLKNRDGVRLHIKKGTTNRLGDAGIKCKGDLEIDGKGTLTIDARNDGHKGIRVGGSLTVTGSPVIHITTSGKATKQEEQRPPEDFMPGGPMPPMPNERPDGKMPPMPERRDDGPMGPPPGGFIRYDFTGATKAIKVMHNATIKGGEMTIRTSTPGAEGLEVKDTLVVAGGKIDIEAYDDGISVGKRMMVEDGDIRVLSTHNDGIDVNGMPPMHHEMEDVPPRYVQTGGTVRTKSTAGPPEDALDTDETPIQHTGGILECDPERRERPFF